MYLFSLIEEKILHQQEIMNPNDLCRYYTEFWQGEHTYRTKKLKSKLQKHEIIGQLAFTSIKSETGWYASKQCKVGFNKAGV